MSIICHHSRYYRHEQLGFFFSKSQTCISKRVDVGKDSYNDFSLTWSPISTPQAMAPARFCKSRNRTQSQFSSKMRSIPTETSVHTIGLIVRQRRWASSKHSAMFKICKYHSSSLSG
jgi:hypothetical protein